MKKAVLPALLAALLLPLAASAADAGQLVDVVATGHGSTVREATKAARAARHYNALVKRLAWDRNAMPIHDAASAMVEAAEHACAIGDEAQALKFYRSAWKLGDSELQSRITAAIALLRLHVD